MTWSTLQVSPEASGTAASITATYPGATQPGTLLCCELLVSSSTTVVTMPAGWVQRVVMNSNGANHVELWDYIDNPGGITSVVIANSLSNNCKATLSEHSNSIAGATVVFNTSGTAKAGTVSSLLVSTSGSALSGDLGVCVFEEHFATASAVTWTTPTGWTTIGDDTASAGNHLYSAYLLSATAGTLSVTGATGTAADNTNGWSGIVACYTAIAPAAWVLTQKSASQGVTASGSSVAGTLPASSTGSASRSHLLCAYLTADVNGTWSVPSGWALPSGLYELYGPNVTAIAYFIDSGSTHVGTSTTFTFSATAKLTVEIAEYDPGLNGVTISLNNSVKATHGAGASSLSGTVTGANAGDLAVGNFQEYFEVSSSYAQTWYDATWAGWATQSGNLQSTVPNPVMLGFGHAWTAAEISGLPAGTIPMQFWDSKTATYANTGTTEPNGSAAASVPTTIVDVETGDITAPSDIAAWINARNALSGGYATNRPTVYLNVNGTYYNTPGHNANDVITPLANTYNLLPGRDYDLWLAHITGTAPTAPYNTTINGKSYPSVATQWANYAANGASYDTNIAWDQTWFNAFSPALTWTTPAGWATVGSDGSPSKVSHQYAAHNLSVAAGSVTVQASSSITSQSAHGWSGVVALFTATLGSGSFGSLSISLPVPVTSLAGTVPLAPVIVNAWPVTDQNTYGNQVTAIANSEGNALIAILGLGSNSESTLPRFAVADDAHNWWTYCGTRQNITPSLNRRVDVWIAPNASPASLVSTAESWYTNGVVGVILEVQNFPEYASIDFVAPDGGLGSSANPNANADTSDWVFGALLLSGVGSTTSVTPPSGLTALSTRTTGSSSTDMTSQVLYPAWGGVAAGPVAETWSWTGNLHYESVLVGFSQSPAAPSQANPNWPGVIVEAAFGFQPGNVSAMPSYTDISTYAQDNAGASVLQAARGRGYELTQPEAGELDIWLDNHTGDFNPANPNAAFYPEVLPEVPVRASTFWNGKQKGIGFSYADKWPQNFRDPQWGETNFSGSDTVGAASNVSLLSAYQSDVLVDQPYAFFPLGEQYTEAGGEPFNNASRTNLIPAYGVDDVNRNGGLALVTGLQFNLEGDSGTGIGLNTGSPNTLNGGPGAFYYDPNMPQLANGVTVEFWMLVSAGPSTPRGALMVGLEGPPGNYPGIQDPIDVLGQGDGSRLEIWANESPLSGGFVNAILSDFNGRNYFDGGAGASWPTNGKIHYVAVTANLAGSTWTLQFYVDGALAHTATSTVVGSNPTTDRMCIGPLVINGGLRPSVDYQISQVALYGYVLDPTRIASHYNTMQKAGSGEGIRERFTRLNAWGGQGLPIASTVSSPTPFMGPADQISGQSLADALNDLTVADGGMSYCDAQGNLWYVSRTWFYNRVPKWTFGDYVQTGFMSDAPNITGCYGVDPVSTVAIFNQPGSFISGGNPTTDPRPAQFPNATPLANYTAYAQLQADISGIAVTSGGNTYNPRTINSWVHWLRYDIESWSATPTPENSDPQTAIANFCDLAHANGYQVIVTPARDLADTDTVHPKLSGETDDAWFLRTNIAAACAAADIFSVQAQADQGTPEFWNFYYSARQQCQAVDPAQPVWCGLSTTYGDGPQMYAAAQTAGIAEGFWLNIIGDYADSVNLMQRLLAQPVQCPYLDADFDFSNTFLYNQTNSQRTISSGQTTLSNVNGQITSLKYNSYGADALEADLASEQQYMPRTPLSQNVETTSDQDVYDRANWSLAKYKQPQLRANQILLDPGSNPPLFAFALGVEQGDVVVVARRPIGGAAYSLLCIVQKVEHDIGPSHWLTTLTLSPYFPEGNVLQLDVAPFNNPANGALGW